MKLLRRSIKICCIISIFLFKYLKIFLLWFFQNFSGTNINVIIIADRRTFTSISISGSSLLQTINNSKNILAISKLNFFMFTLWNHLKLTCCESSTRKSALLPIEVKHPSVHQDEIFKL